MDSKFQPGVKVKVKPGNEFEGKTGKIRDIQWMGKNPLTPNAVMVTLDGETEDRLFDSSDLDVI